MSEPTPEPAPTLVVDCWRIDVAGLADDQLARWEAAEDEQRERAAVFAASALRSLTGGAVEPCVHVVRPTAGPCSDRTWAVYPVGGYGAVFSPRLDSGTWINIRCGCGSAGCGHELRTIRLPGAREVAAVLLDGEAFTGWRLEAGGVLRRLDGQAWPRSQPLEVAADAAGSFVVAYYSDRPGRAGEMAAGRLAVEFLAAITGASCSLPKSVTQVQRNGVTITKTPGIFPGGLTGIQDVDAWVRSVNPYALQEPSEVLSPDLPRMNAAAGAVTWTPPA